MESRVPHASATVGRSWIKQGGNASQGKSHVEPGRT